MDSTTLVTFWFKAPSEIRTVELFGSWDNFHSGYRMQYDAHKGRGSWTCCPSFDRIICDGDKPNWSKPRSGALKQGGRYWYYYRLNDEDERCDQFKPTTSECPLLPGQVLNVMDIPVEVMERPQRVSSASAVASMSVPHMTTDPADRYKKVTRRHPTRLPRYYCSADAIREQAASSIIEGGGPVMQSTSTCNRSLKRVRGPEAAVYQQPGACFVRSTSVEMEALVQSISTTVPELDRLPQLRPFGPSPDYEIDTRPSTRCGLDRGLAPAVGLGLSITTSGFGSAMLCEQGDENVSSGVQQQPQMPTLQPHSLSFLENYNYNATTKPETPNWPFTHPNPLRGNPNEPSPFIPSPFSTSQYHSCHSGSPRSLVSPIEDYNPRTSYGPEEMCSPTFTAATASSVDDTPTPGVEYFPLDLGEECFEYNTNPIDGNSTTIDRIYGYSYDNFSRSNFPVQEAKNHDRTPRPDMSCPATAKYTGSSVTLTPLAFRLSQEDIAPIRDSHYPRPLSLADEDFRFSTGDDFAEDVLGALGIAA